MAGSSPSLTETGRNHVQLSYLVGDDTWKVAEIEVPEKPATGLLKFGELEVIVNVTSKIPDSEREAVILAIQGYHQRTYKTRSNLTINFN